MPLRDYAGEIREVINEVTGTRPYVSRVAAAEVVAKLKANYPDLLAGWLHLQAEDLICHAINERDRRQRAITRAWAGRAQFRAAVDASNSGDSQPLHRFLEMPFVIATGERVALGRMTGPDCAYVARSYESTARRAAMHGALLRALERRIGTDRVEDHYTEDQMRALWQSFRPET